MPSVFAGKTSLQEHQASEVRGKVWSNKELLLVDDDQVLDDLNNLNAYKSIGI